MMLSDNELFYVLFSKELTLLRNISKIILYLKNRQPQTVVCQEYLQFFILGHKLLLNHIMRRRQAFLSE